MRSVEALPEAAPETAIRVSTSSPSQRRETITAYVYTYNEERNIADCVESVAWCDEVLVVDS